MYMYKSIIKSANNKRLDPFNSSWLAFHKIAFIKTVLICSETNCKITHKKPIIIINFINIPNGMREWNIHI